VSRTAILILIAFQIQAAVYAQFPSFDSYSISKISSVFFNFSKSSRKNKDKAEIPPWIIPGGYRSYFFVDGNDSYIWSTKSSITDNKAISLDNAVGPNQASLSYTHSRSYNPNDKIENWKRNYDAVYSAEYFNHPVKGPVSLGFLHGENKNQVSGYRMYQNTIQPNVTINLRDPASYSGGKPFHDGWNAYNAIISAAWISNNKQTNWGQQFFKNELGPIAWPSTGYVTGNGIKCTSGLRHPSSVIAGDYVYIFYADSGPFGNNIPPEEGRQEGIKVIRASVADALDAHNYSVYYRDPAGNESWLPSLPEGFTKENMLDFIAVKGPKSTDIMNDYKNISQEVRFSVARVRNTNYFIGVEEYIDVTDAKKYKVALRFSNDLTHWTDRALTISVADSWDKTQMNYPIFLSKDGWSNTEIDIDDFYILGTETEPGNFVNKIHITKYSRAPTQMSSLMSYNLQNIPGSTIYPNPATGSFQIAYSLDKPSLIRIDIFDLLGKKLATIDNEQKEQGKYIDQFDISGYPDGLYLIEIVSDNRRRTYKLIKN